MIKIASANFGQRPYLGQYSVGKREGIGNNLAISNLIWFKFQMEFICDSPVRTNVVGVAFGTLVGALIRGNVL